MKALYAICLLLGSFFVPAQAFAQLFNNPLYANVPVTTGPQPESKVLSLNQDDKEYCFKEAKKKGIEPGCVYFVNLSNHKIVQFYYTFQQTNPEQQDGGETKLVLSKNQFVPGFPFEPSRWTSYRKPKNHGCYLVVKYVLDHKSKTYGGVQNICGSPENSLMMIKNPRKGIVIVETDETADATPPQVPGPSSSPPAVVAAIAPTPNK